MEVKENNAIKAILKKTKKEYFCVYDMAAKNGNDTEIIKLDPEKAAGAAAEQVQKLNGMLKRVALDAALKALPTATGLTHDSEVLDPIKVDVKGQIMACNSDLQALMGNGDITPDEAEAAKILCVAEAIKKSCNSNGDCIKAMEGGIKDGAIPLENDGKANANSPKNPYAGKEEKKPSGKLDKDGKPDDSQAPPDNDGPKKPELKDINKALKAIARYMKGQKAENLFKLDKFCDPDSKKGASDDTAILSRSINAIGMLGTTDPMLWFLGKSTQSLTTD